MDAEGWDSWAWAQQTQSSASWETINRPSLFLSWKVDTTSVVSVRPKCYQEARMTAPL